MQKLTMIFLSCFILGVSAMASANNGNLVFRGTVTNQTCGRVAAHAVFNVIKETMQFSVRPEQISAFAVTELVPGKLYSVQAIDDGANIVDSQVQTSVLGNGDCEAEAYKILPNGTWTYLANAY